MAPEAGADFDRVVDCCGVGRGLPLQRDVFFTKGDDCAVSGHRRHWGEKRKGGDLCDNPAVRDFHHKCLIYSTGKTWMTFIVKQSKEMYVTETSAEIGPQKLQF